MIRSSKPADAAAIIDIADTIGFQANELEC